MYATDDILKENDKKDLKLGINRSLHERYQLVHEQLFNRKTKDYLINLVDKFINDGPNIRKSKAGKEITSLLAVSVKMHADLALNLFVGRP